MNNNYFLNGKCSELIRDTSENSKFTNLSENPLKNSTEHTGILRNETNCKKGEVR